MTQRWLCGLGVALVACAGFGQPQKPLAPAGEYELYRRTRTLPSVEERLAASALYLQRHPEGQYAPLVRAWYERVEPAYFQSAYNSEVGLTKYLTALPRGPSADKAARRLEELRLSTGYTAKRDRAALARARRVEHELEQAGQQRREFLEAFSAWVSRLVGVVSHGENTEEGSDQLLERFRTEAPVATCVPDACTKKVGFLFQIPVEGRLVTRRVQFEIELEFQEGEVQKASLSGVGLYDRLLEAVRLSPSFPADGMARVEAVGQAVQLISQSIEEQLPEAQCRVDAASPVILARSCQGLSLLAYAATSFSEPDRLEVSVGELPPRETSQPDANSSGDHLGDER